LRYFAEIAYSGTSYHGWQEQKNALGLQQVISEAMTILLKTGIKITGSGRTDTGVHALRQVAHFDVENPVDAENLRFRLNRFLPDDISILRIFPVHEKAHARYSAIARTYEYWITYEKNPFMIRRAWYIRNPLDIDLLNRAAGIMLEFNDFESFSRVKTDVNHFRCQLHSAGWKAEGDILKFNIESDRFLRGMVRTVVGTMVEMARGKISFKELRNIIDKKDRRLAGPAAPAHGLYLIKIDYPRDIFVKL
jgi:tRNA pseudouridine38-40 synthase